MASTYQDSQNCSIGDREDLIIPELEASTVRNNFWTERDVAVLRKYYGNAKTGDIAKYLGRTTNSVARKATSLNLVGG